MLRKSIFGLGILLSSLVLLAQDQTQPQKQDKKKDDYVLTVETLEVQLPVSVLDNLDARGETALYDALYLAADHVTKEGKKDKKAILLITDGEDNASKYGINKVIEALRQAKITVYAVGLLEENDQRGGLFKKPPSKKAKDDLLKFAEVTGGQAFFPKTLDEVEELVKHIADDLRNHYTIAYTP